MGKIKKLLNKLDAFYIGIDVGGTQIKIGIFNKKKKLVHKLYIDTKVAKRNSEKAFLDSIFMSIDKYISDNDVGLAKNILLGIGFAMPGPVINNKLLHAVNINWKKEYDIVSATKKRFGKNIRVCVLNDANAAALGEYNYTLKGKCESICLITLGTGVGTGIIINGKLIEGKSGIAGEVSHIRVDYSDNAVKCNCGNIGCVETMASCTGLVSIYNRLANEKSTMENVYSKDIKKKYNNNSVGASYASPYSDNQSNKKGAREIVHLAKRGDSIALNALNISLDYLSKIIVILMHVYEPEVILIGGGMSNAGTIITNIIKKHLKEKVFMTKLLPNIMIAKLKNDAGLYGAVVNL